MKKKIFLKILKRIDEKGKSLFVRDRAEDFIRSVELGLYDPITYEMGKELISYGILKDEELDILIPSIEE